MSHVEGRTPGRPTGNNHRQQEAIDFLWVALEYEAVPVASLMREAARRGISKGTLLLVKSALPIRAIKSGKFWVWSLIGEFDEVVSKARNSEITLHDAREESADIKTAADLGLSVNDFGV